jgi:hypothetical protein
MNELEHVDAGIYAALGKEAERQEHNLELLLIPIDFARLSPILKLASWK